MTHDIIKIAMLVFLPVLLLCLSPILNGVMELSTPKAFNKDIASLSAQETAFPAAALLGYIQRGDWESPDILFMADNSDWRDSLEIIVAAAHQERTPVYMLAGQDDVENEKYLSLLNNQYGAQIIMVPYDTPWIRDYGPIQLKARGKTVHWLDFNYTEERPNDDLVPQQLAGYMDISVAYGNYYLEGGAIISNGRGLCAMTVKSLEEASVDPASSKEFNAFLGVVGCQELAVLPVLTGETTGHADIIAQFFAPDIVAVAAVDKNKSPGISAELDQAVESLAAAANASDQPLRVVRLPLHVEGEVFYSYVNGTRMRKSYLVPSFKNVPPEMERKAYGIIRSVMPAMRLFPIPADVMVEKGGAVHCITLGLNIPGSFRPWRHWI